MSCCSPNKKSHDESDRTRKSCCSSSQGRYDHEEKDGKANDEHSSCCSAPNANAFQGKKKITRQMTIEQILGMFPYKAQRLSQEITNAGLHCIGCHAAVWETLEGGMLSHGKSEEEINALVDRLNALLEEAVDIDTIRITSRGAAKFLAILSEEGKQGWGMRFSEEMAGCNGFEYVLDFSEKADSDDETFTSNGIEIHVKKAKVPALKGSEIDYVEGLRGSGFKISNPNVKSACGCGSSHNY
jgi:iron-sulfur cluster assembly accessory protein